MAPFKPKTVTLALEEQEAPAVVIRGNRVVRWVSRWILPGAVTGGIMVVPLALAQAVKVAMAPFKPKTLTLALEERQARAVLMRGNRVVRWASQSVPPGAISGGIVADPHAVAQVVRELLKAVKAGSRKPLVSLGGLHPVVRLLTLPPLKGDLLVEAVRREMRRDLPSSIEYYHIAWHPMESSKTATRVYALAVPSAELESHLAALKQAQLSPKYVTLEALAVASVLEGREAIVINMKDTGFSIVVLRDGAPTVMRDISYSQEHLPVADRIADLGRELQLTAASFGVDRPDDPANPPLAVYVIGKNASDDALMGQLAQEIGIRPSLFKPLALYPPAFPVEEYAANLGLALSRRNPLGYRHAAKASPTFDMVPEGFRRRIVPLPQAALIIGLVVMLGGVTLPLRGALQPDAETLQMRADIQTYQRSIDETRAQNDATRATQAEAAKQLAEAAKLQESLKLIGSQPLLWPKVLRDSQEAFPDIELVTFSETSTKLTIVAQAPSTAQAIAFATYLEKSGRFSSVTIPRLSRGSQGPNGTGADFTVVGFEGG